MGSLLLHRGDRHLLFLLSSAIVLIMGAQRLVEAARNAHPYPSSLVHSQTPPSPLSSSTQNCTQLDEQTEGPYWVEENIGASNLRENMSYGVPLNITFKIVNGSLSSLADTCVPIEAARIDIWHCRYDGLYSDVERDSTLGETWLRGYQYTNSSGFATFYTIYPGWYPYRTIHIHMRVRVYDGNTIRYEETTQLYFDDIINDAICANVYPYNVSRSMVRDTFNTNDRWFASCNIITLIGNYNESDGYTSNVELSLPFKTSVSMLDNGQSFKTNDGRNEGFVAIQ